MTITPGTPDDWTDTNPESTTPERILPTPEGVTPPATKVAMVCYAVGAASKCWEHPERAGVFDSDRASQIVTELCVALGVEQQGDAAPESARPATLTGERLVKAPGQGEDSQRPSEPEDPDPEDAVYLSGPMTGLPDFNRPAFHAAAAALRAQGHVVINPAEVDLGPDASWADYMRVHLAEIARRVARVFVLPGWEGSRGAQLEVHVARALGLPVEDAPAPVDPDAAAIEALVTAYRRSPECSTDSVFGEAMLDHLRAQGFDVTPRAEQ